jgi:ethanolamine ammonia-lyase large subunit
MGVPGADDIMLNYQSTSFHDALFLRRILGLRPAPEFESWLNGEGFHRLTRQATSPNQSLEALLVPLLETIPKS